jgi:hypothetical protein
MPVFGLSSPHLAIWRSCPVQLGAVYNILKELTRYLPYGNFTYELMAFTWPKQLISEHK